MDSLVLGQVFASVSRPEGARVPQDAPVMREMVEDWLRRRGGHLDAGQFVDPLHPRWEYTTADPNACGEP